MPLKRVTAEFTFSWLTHDSWSEAYVGTRGLIYQVLPASDGAATAEDGALCQLGLVGANHLMEIAIYSLLRPHAKATGKVAALTEALLEDASYYHMLTRWLPAVSNKTLDLSAEPFLSTERLRRRRNDTVHKSSTLATIQMARSALFSAVQGTKALYACFDTIFPYEPFLSKFPPPDETWFSSVRFPSGA